MNFYYKLLTCHNLIYVNSYDSKRKNKDNYLRKYLKHSERF